MRVASISEPNSSLCPGVNGSERVHPSSAYDEYYSAIVTNDVNKVLSVLAKTSSEKLRLLLETKFEFEESESILLRELSYSPTLPLHVAVYVGAHDVIKVLLDKGINVMKTDFDGYNIFHTLVAFAFYEPTQ